MLYMYMSCRLSAGQETLYEDGSEVRCFGASVSVRLLTLLSPLA
jgi:hypothetical protein